MKRDTYLDWDLEDATLEIRTDSALGSEERVAVLFYTAIKWDAGRIYLKFNAKIQYWLGWCIKKWIDLPVTPPTSMNKVWGITLIKTSGIRLKITCNDLEVLNLLLSATTCAKYGRKWSHFWNRNVERINFKKQYDTASNGCRSGEY